MLGAVLALIPVAAGAHAPARLPVGACLNLGNHLDAASGGEHGPRLSVQDMADIRATGFATVRLTVNWSAHQDAAAPYAIDPAWLARVAGLVDAGLAAGLNVILDSHRYAGFDDHPAAAAPRLAAAWGTIAARLRDRPDAQLWFEIENEPAGRVTNAMLPALLAPSLAAIRQASPHRPVLIGGADWSSPDSLATLTLPDDPAVWPTFHEYRPMDFTHQGAAWLHPTPPTGRVWGSAADRALLAHDVAAVRAVIARTGRVPVLGETGVYEGVPAAQRAGYVRAVNDAFARLGVTPCEWAYTATFAWRDQRSGAWDAGLLAAIGLTGPSTAR